MNLTVPHGVSLLTSNYRMKCDYGNVVKQSAIRDNDIRQNVISANFERTLLTTKEDFWNILFLKYFFIL